MTTFDEFLRGLGLTPRTVSADSKWRRCPTTSHPKKRNGSYKLDSSGSIGWAQDWATMEQPAQWTAMGENGAPVRVNQEEMRENHRQAMAKQAEAIRRAQEFYRVAAPLRGGHPYLERQGLDMTGCFGIRLDAEGWIVVPAWRDRQLVSYQRISPTGEKRFAPGCPIQGSSYVIERRGATVTVLVEGWATGLAVYAAMRDARVIVGWHASNLALAPGTVRGWRAVAADNDHQTAERIGRNPGRDAAEEAARVLKCRVAWPEGIEGTDWADYRREKFEALVQVKQKHQTDGAIRRVVDADIRRQIMAAAVFV
jgi:putative DNA primase/helicase